MEPSCPLLHPHTPSFPLSLPSPCCLPCILSRLRTPTLLPTLRRGEVALLRTLATSPHQLLHRAPHLAPELLLDLLNTLSTLSDRKDDQLANDVRTAVAELAVGFDAAAVDPHDLQAKTYILVELVASYVVDAALKEVQGPKSRSANVARQPTLQFAVLLRAAWSHPQLSRDGVLHAVDVAVSGRAAALGQRVLAMLPAEDDMFNDVGEVICSVLVAVDWKEIDCVAFVQAVADALPQRRMPEAERLFLDVVFALWQRALENRSEMGGEVSMLMTTLMDTKLFVEVIKGNVLSEDVPAVERVTKIVCALCAESSEAAEHFCTSGVFEYVVECIRTVAQSPGNIAVQERNKLCLAVESIAAIAVRKPKSLPQKWCYCLDVIVSVCEHLSEGPQARMVTEILGHAFRHAPLPLFTDELIDQFVAFEMMIVTKMCQNAARNDNSKEIEYGTNQAAHYELLLTSGIEDLTELFARFRPSVETIHSVLRVCEASAQQISPLPCMFALMNQIITQFTSMCDASNGNQQSGSLAVQDLGQRLLFTVFDLWAGALEGLVDDTEKALRVFKTVDGFLSAIDMFSSSLSPAFVSFDCCSRDDQRAMRSWCWKYIPPCKIWYLFSEFHRLACLEQREVNPKKKWVPLQRYLWLLSRDGEVPDLEELSAISTSEDSFLESLGRGQLNSSDLAMSLFEMGMEADSLTSLCAPDLLSDALCVKLRALLSLQNEDSVPILRALRGISFMCFRYGLQFRLLDIPSQALEVVFQAEEFSIADNRDFDIFRQTVLRGRTSLADVLAWNRFANYAQTSDASNRPHEIKVWTLLCENTEAVISVTHALLKTTSPQNVAGFLLDMFEFRDTHSKLITSFEKAGVSDVLCGLLKKLPTRSSKTAVPKTVQVGADCPHIEVRRISCFIAVSSQGGFIAGSRPNWELLRLVSETFSREAISLEGRLDVFPFLACLIRCLIAIVTNARNGNVIYYLLQSGVVGQLVRMVRISSGRSLSQDQVASASACLLVLILADKGSAGANTPLNLMLTDLIQDLSCWERLLCSFPMSSGGDRYCKVTNCCFLLDALLKRTSLAKQTRLSVCSRRIIVPLTRAACCSDILLEEAATRVLTKMMEMNTPQVAALSSLCLLRQLSARTLSKICSSSERTVSDVEIMYARASVLCGHADNQLHVLDKVVRAWCEVKQDESNAEDKTIRDAMLPHMSALVSAVGDRVRALAKLNPSDTSSCDHRIGGDMEDIAKAQDASSSNRKKDEATQILSGRYSIVLRTHSSSIHLTGS